AGLVTIASVASVVTEVHPRVLEATSLRLPETPEATVAAGALDLLVEKAPTVDAVAIGPGLSTNAETVEVIRRTVAALENPLVAARKGGGRAGAGPRGTGDHRRGSARCRRRRDPRPGGLPGGPR